MSHIKAPTEIQGLKLDSVKDQIQRLQAALTIKNLKSQMDKRVEDAQKMKDNAEKSGGRTSGISCLRSIPNTRTCKRG